jgi:integrase
MAHVRRRGKKWQVVHGDRSYGTYPNKDAAETVRLDVELRHKLGGLYRAKPETFQQAAHRHLERRHRELQPAAYQARVHTYKRLRHLDAHLVSSLSVSLVEDTIDAMAKTTPVRAQRCLAFLKTVLKEARARGQQVDAGVLEIEPPSHRAQEAEVMELDDAYELGIGLPSTVANLPAFAVLTGLRQGELFALRVDDWDGNRVFVRAGKTDAARRWVSLCQPARAILEEQAAIAANLNSPYLFPRPQGGQWDRHAFGKPYRRAPERSRVPPVQVPLVPPQLHHDGETGRRPRRSHRRTSRPRRRRSPHLPRLPARPTRRTNPGRRAPRQLPDGHQTDRGNFDGGGGAVKTAWITGWAVQGSNLRPPACKGSPPLCDDARQNTRNHDFAGRLCATEPGPVRRITTNDYSAYGHQTDGEGRVDAR